MRAGTREGPNAALSGQSPYKRMIHRIPSRSEEIVVDCPAFKEQVPPLRQSSTIAARAALVNTRRSQAPAESRTADGNITRPFRDKAA